MAMEIKAIPTLKGKEAEHFVKAADKAYKNQNKQDFSKHVLEARAVLNAVWKPPWSSTVRAPLTCSITRPT